MDSFVEAQNNLKRMSYAGCVILFKTRQSHAARFSFMPMVMKSPGLKPIEAQNARSSSACVPYLPSTLSFGMQFWPPEPGNRRPKLTPYRLGCCAACFRTEQVVGDADRGDDCADSARA